MVTEVERLTNGVNAVNGINEISPKTKENKDMDKINSIKSEEQGDKELVDDKEIITEYNKELTPLVDKVKFANDAHSERSESPVERVKFAGFDDKDSICSESSSEDDKLPPIPDGGWGWVVVFSAFLVSACADGLVFSFGLLHEEFTSYFKQPQSKTALIGSIFIATPLLAGPIMSALVDRFGCRVTTMVAGLISAISFLLASISNSVEVLCVTFGFLSGLAMGVFYVTAVVSVAFWFEKRRNFAVSLASCGIGFGTLFYSPLTHYWLQEYGWRSTVILLGGTVLNMCVCGAVMRNPEWLKIKQKKERALSRRSSRRSSSVNSLASRSIGEESVFLSPEELKSLLTSGKSPDYILSQLATTIAEAEQLEATTQMNAELATKRIYSALHLPTFVQRNETVPPEVIENLMENKRLYNIILHNYPEIITRRKSDVNIAVEPTPTDAAIEPPKLPVTIKAKNKDVQDILGDQSSKKEGSKEGLSTTDTKMIQSDENSKTTGSKECLNDDSRVIQDNQKAGSKDCINNGTKVRQGNQNSKKVGSKEGLNDENDTKDVKTEPLVGRKPSKDDINKNKEAKDAKRNSIVDKKDGLTKTDSNNLTKPQHRKSIGQRPGAIIPPAGWGRTLSTVDPRILKDMPLYRNTMMHRGAMMSVPQRYKLKASSLPDMYRNSDWSIASSEEWTFWDRTLELVKNTFDFRMFTEFHFFMFNLSTVILSVWFIVPYFFLTSYMNELKVEGGETMISIIGIASSVGIVTLGWAGDQPWINVSKTYAVCLIICGFSIAAYPLFITNYWALTVISAIFGISFASSYSYMPAILMELMPLNRFTVAYGLMLLAEGIGHLAGPPLGGLLYDYTKSWKATFYVGGFWLVISGLCIAVIAFTKNFRICGSAPLLKDLEEKESDTSSEASA
ncbi:major facilitator superfamily domain-containing protein [Phthorimaea operculella]|nr:major facilitator superfamily domain-containing protein [Phthorimaea operculella]